MKKRILILASLLGMIIVSAVWGQGIVRVITQPQNFRGKVTFSDKSGTAVMVVDGAASDEVSITGDLNVSGTSTAVVGAVTTGDLDVNTDSATALRVRDDATNTLLIDTANGKVGIGPVTPSDSLGISGANKTIVQTEQIANILSTNALGIDLGGSLGFGGVVNSAGGHTVWASISGRKETAVSDHDGGYLSLGTRTSGGSVAERMRIDNNGRVGIGTNFALALPAVSGAEMQLAIGPAGSARMTVLKTHASATSYGGFTIDTVSNGDQIWLHGIGTGGAASYDIAFNIDKKFSVRLNTGAEALVVDTPTYEVAVGNISGAPDSELHVMGNIDGVSGMIVENRIADATDSDFSATNEIWFGFNGDNEAGKIILGKEEDYETAAKSDSYMAFHTDINGTATERMRITSAGNIGINQQSPDASSLIDMVSTAKGFLPPRMTTTQRDAISSPATGLVIYNTTTNVLNFYNGSAWGAV